MCFEKQLLWWLFETHVAFRRISVESTHTISENGAVFTPIPLKAEKPHTCQSHQ